MASVKARKTVGRTAARKTDGRTRPAKKRAAPKARETVGRTAAPKLRSRMPAEATDLAAVCKRIVELARKAGADEAEAYAERTRRATVRVRDGEIEDLTQATGKGVGLRVVVGGASRPRATSGRPASSASW
jgi:PmbA/TldA metallopeptidase domain 1